MKHGPKMTRLGTMLRVYFAQNMLRTEDVAKELLINHATLVRWINGSSKPTLDINLASWLLKHEIRNPGEEK